MKRIKIRLITSLFAAAVSLPGSGAAQTPRAPAEPTTTAQPERTIEAQPEPVRWGRPVLRVGQDYTLRAGDSAREAVVIAGDAVIAGRVDRDVVVVLGKAQLASGSHIDGSLFVIGGSVTAASGALVDTDLVVVGGGLDAPGDFMPGGQQIVIGPAAIGGRLEAVVPWISHGLLWGRPIVPDLPWVWRIVGIFFLVYLVLNLVLHGPVGDCAETLMEKPLTALGVGLLVLLLTGPVCVLLAVSVVGLAVVPFVICALLAAGIIGRIGVTRWIGMTIVGQRSHENRLQGLRSFAVGSGAICVAYMVPLLGFLAWTMIGVFALGAATLAFIGAYRRENPAPTPRIPAAAPTHEYVRTVPPTTDAAAMSVGGTPVPAAPVTGADLASFPRARFLERAAAFGLDVFLVFVAIQLLDLTRREMSMLLLLLAYHIGFWTWKGTTVGGIICQLRVVRVDGAPLRFVDALVRGLSSIFSLAALGLGCLWIVRDAERQAWHDKIAGTYVVKVPRNWPL